MFGEVGLGWGVRMIVLRSERGCGQGGGEVVEEGARERGGEEVGEGGEVWRLR